MNSLILLERLSKLLCYIYELIYLTIYFIIAELHGTKILRISIKIVGTDKRANLMGR